MSGRQAGMSVMRLEVGRLSRDSHLKKKPRPMAITMERGVNLATSYFRTTYRSTIIGAAAFHFRVRNGNGWGHCARITRRLANLKPRKRTSRDLRWSMGGTNVGAPALRGRTPTKQQPSWGGLFGPQIRQASRDPVRSNKWKQTVTSSA